MQVSPNGLQFYVAHLAEKGPWHQVAAQLSAGRRLPGANRINEVSFRPVTQFATGG